MPSSSSTDSIGRDVCSRFAKIDMRAEVAAVWDFRNGVDMVAVCEGDSAAATAAVEASVAAVEVSALAVAVEALGTRVSSPRLSQLCHQTRSRIMPLRVQKRGRSSMSAT
jgi:hypothetical protein